MSTRRSAIPGLLLAAIGVSAFAAEPQSSASEQPIATGLCEVLANPIAYDHKLVRVTGRISRGFEDFILKSAACEDSRPLWLEYGGPNPAEVIYCCVGERADPPNGRDPLWVEGIETSLVADEKFAQFEKRTKRLKRGRTVEATLIGRVFAAGSYTTEAGETEEIGYGHFGMFSLFVIQQVVAVKK